MDYPLAIQPVLTFKTSRGSQYWVDKDGRSQRFKSYHPEHGVNDRGLKSLYQHIIFVNNADADQLLKAGSRGRRWQMIIKKGTVGIVALGTNNKYQLVTALYPYVTRPQIGFAPIEFNILRYSGELQGYFPQKNVHIGNEIVAIKYLNRWS